MRDDKPTVAAFCPMLTLYKRKKERMAAFLLRLEQLFPDPACELIHRDAFELICATILSAQCTDKQVNKVTPALFAAYPTALALSRADVEKLQNIIHSTGFYKNKAKNLIGMACAVTERHNGIVPNTLEELIKLPGVGRKTANVVLGNAYG
ncbi:MAG: endonuclease III, partial [Deferribacteraceae bacterium]|nr:endonuclease III [Deferribacteraceae bacterium]